MTMNFYFFSGSLFGAIDTTMISQSITREKYLENGYLPDWFTDK
jgi:hypothetical protein